MTAACAQEGRGSATTPPNRRVGQPAKQCGCEFIVQNDSYFHIDDSWLRPIPFLQDASSESPPQTDDRDRRPLQELGLTVNVGARSAEMGEERRSCFVAILRARESTTLTGARTYNPYPNGESQFYVKWGFASTIRLARRCRIGDTIADI